MENFLIYLLKSAGLLSVFYLFYFILLKRDTWFATNRQFLLGGLFASAVLPAIYFTRTVFIEATTTQYYFAEGDFTITEVLPKEHGVSPLQILFLLYILGIVYMAARLVLQFISLGRLLVSGKRSNFGKIKIIETSRRIAPFSILNYIVYNPALHPESELIHIMKHEEVHVSQYHSIDIILANFNLVYQWFNPFAWLYLKAIQQNLEFIADQEAVKEISCKKEYQKALVKISVENLDLSLTNNFYQSLIKKRIIMLNKKKSAESNSWKVGLIIPVLLGFMFLFNVKTVAQVKEKEPATSEAKSDLENSSRSSGRQKEKVVVVNKSKKEGEEPVYILNGKVVNATVLDSLNTIQIDSIQVLKNVHATSIYGAKGKNGVVVIHTGNDSIKSKRFKSTTYSSEPTFVKDRRITITSARGFDSDSTHSNRTTSYIRHEANAPFVISADSVDINAYQYSTRTSPKETFYLRTNTEKPLYVINGEEMSEDFDADFLDPENISSIIVLKGEIATKKYGKRGENGVIEITTKENGSLAEGTTPTFAKVDASTTEEGLKITRQQLKEQANLEVSFEEVKRNKNGLITHIKISGKKNGSNASATYEVEEGIPDIFIGLRNNSVIISSNPPRK